MNTTTDRAHAYANLAWMMREIHPSVNWKSFGSRAFGVVHAAVVSQYTYFLHIVYMGIHNLAHNSLLANIREKIQVNLVSYFTIFVISLEMH